MSKVYVVEVGSYSDRYISAVFTTRDLAEEYVRVTRNREWARTVTKHHTLMYPDRQPPPPPTFPEPELPLREWHGKYDRDNSFGDVEEYELWDELPVVTNDQP